MLKIVLPAITTGDTIQPEKTLELEHSLVSMSKWESLHTVPFYKKDGLSPLETVSYIQLMLVGEPPSNNWIERLSEADFKTITDYINSKQTATWFREDPNAPGPREIVTNELIYFWMISFKIPFEPCQNWHVNRLMTLIKICGIKQTKDKPMSRQAQAEEYRRLNEQRRRDLGTNG